MRTLRIFDATFLVLGVAGLALIAGTTLSQAAWYWYVLAAVGTAALFALYAWAFRSHMLVGQDQQPAWKLMLVVAATFLASFGLSPLMFLQVAAHLMVWATVRRAWAATAWSFVVSAASALGALIGVAIDPAATDTRSAYFTIIMTGVIAFVAALAYGLWIRYTQTIAQEKTRLYDELQATQAELARTSVHAGSLEERARMSRELHDTLAQSLSAIVMVTSNAARTPETSGDFALIEQMARDALVEARSVVAELAPLPSSGNAGAMLAGVVERVVRESGLAVSTDLEPLAVPPPVELVLVRCTQEALANVRKHARASQAWVRLHRDGPLIRLEVSDDGLGPSAPTGAPGFGLAGMRDRVDLVGGTMSFGARDGGGARLVVEVPEGVADDQSAGG